MEDPITADNCWSEVGLCEPEKSQMDLTRLKPQDAFNGREQEK